MIEYTADLDLYYSDSSGFRSYISNTSNQISTSIISEENIINMEPCIGIGFDEIGLSFENIAISSSNYQTTNMGLEHLEINNENEFEKLSSSLEELKQSNRNEIVLFRKNVDSFTKSSYIFVIFTGNIKSNVLLSEAEKLAEENNMKLIIFNIPEIKKSMKRNLIK